MLNDLKTTLITARMITIWNITVWTIAVRLITVCNITVWMRLIMSQCKEMFCQVLFDSYTF